MAWQPAWPSDQATPPGGAGRGAHRRTPSTPSAAAHASRRRVRTGSRTTNLEPNILNPDAIDLGSLDISQLQAESSSDSDVQGTRHRSKPSHGRSMSNPFPTLFASKKKKKATPSGFSDSDSSDDEGLMRNSHNTKQAMGQTLPAASHGRRNSFATGPCITCGSLMRWAQGVEAFRCSVCITVNDLVPGGKAVDASSGKSTRPEDDITPISVEQTRALAQQCIRSYLIAVLSDVDSRHGVPRDQAPLAMSKIPRRPIPSATSPASGSSARANSKEKDQPHATTSCHSRPGQALDGRSVRATQPALKSLPTPRNPAIAEKKPLPSSGSWPQAAPATADKIREETSAKRIFKPLEDEIITHFLSITCLDSSFLPNAPDTSPGHSFEHGHGPNLGHRREMSEAGRRTMRASDMEPTPRVVAPSPFRSGHWASRRQARPSHQRQMSEGGVVGSSSCISRPIRIDWPAVDQWFEIVVNAGATWLDVYGNLVETGICVAQPNILLEQIETEILKGQKHAQRVLLKAIETVLKRPGRRIGESGDFRFLIMVLANPLLYASCKLFAGIFQRAAPAQRPLVPSKSESGRGTGPASGQHSGIIKRILGLISNAPDEWQRHVTACFSHFSDARFMHTKDLVAGFLAYRLVRHNEKTEETKSTIAEELVPRVVEGASAAALQAALSQTPGPAKAAKTKPENKITHGDDWQITAAVRVLGLLFSANNAASSRRHALEQHPDSEEDRGTDSRMRLRGQILPTSDFYMTLLDSCDLVGDFESWELKTPRFTFCRYPFLLSIWAKIQILEHEAHRQMKTKARDAFFDSIMTHRNFDQHFSLSVRRDCLVDDSLTAVSEAVGSGGEDLKKGLRIGFKGEEGIDAGGLRKEWFLLLVREVFNPDHGMFSYDEESHYCYFNPNSFETSDQFFLVGVVLGLAIYNSTILDIALPPFAFRKLLLAGPSPPAGMIAVGTRPHMAYMLSDLAEYRPALARGLQQLLDYEGDVETAFSLDFTISVDKYGVLEQVPLCAEGDKRPVTASNRREYVHLYVRYLLDTVVSRQFEPFKRGFFTVCDSNALLLFRPEEIELLVRGSDERLDIGSLRVAASYDNWGANSRPESELSIQWFWQTFEEATAQDQRKLLTFVTGSDRIPATGPASLSIRILCLGPDTGRFPTARTCFNTLTLYRYRSKEALQKKLWDAVRESEGFGLK